MNSRVVKHTLNGIRLKLAECNGEVVGFVGAGLMGHAAVRREMGTLRLDRIRGERRHKTGGVLATGCRGWGQRGDGRRGQSERRSLSLVELRCRLPVVFVAFRDGGACGCGDRSTAQPLERVVNISNQAVPNGIELVIHIRTHFCIHGEVTVMSERKIFMGDKDATSSLNDFTYT